MDYGICVEVWGDYACFTRPEMKVERVSYDVMTPSAARGILEAIHWKPAIRWVIDRIHVLNPIRFTTIRRNEVADVIPTQNITAAMKGNNPTLGLFVEDSRQQRAATILRDVAYAIEAHFEFVSSEDNNPGKHRDIFRRRAEKGQCFNQPYLGCREFSAHFKWVDSPRSSCHEGDVDLGWMLHDIDFENNMEPRFFRAMMRDGVLDVPSLKGKETTS